MSIIGKKPFISTLIESLSDSEVATLSSKIDNVGTIIERSLLGDSAQLTSSDKGIKSVRLRLTPSEYATGILVYNDDYCVLISWTDVKTGKLGLVLIGSSLKSYSLIDKNLTIEELRRVLSAVGGSGFAGVVIQANGDTTISGWQVPNLTVEQVEQAYNALAAGKHCTITNEDGTVHYTAILSDVVTEKANIVITHYWLGYIDYQVTDHDTVDIEVHQIGGGGTKKYMHNIIMFDNYTSGMYFFVTFSFVSSRSTSYAGHLADLKSDLTAAGFTENGKMLQVTWQRMITSSEITFAQGIYMWNGSITLSCVRYNFSDPTSITQSYYSMSFATIQSDIVTEL